MSLHRYAAKRDANEPQIRKRFAAHGWHTEQVSSAGGWDLDCYPAHPNVTFRGAVRTVVAHVDVKDGDGRVTTAQQKKWTALRSPGIPVYVVRTEADVDALVGGTLAPWAPEANPRSPRPPRAQKTATRKEERKGKPRGSPKASYTPPRSKPVDVAKEAEVFAPCPHPTCSGDCEHTKP